jgi:hypothetical protein
MDRELRALLAPYMDEPTRPSGDQTIEQALNFRAVSLAYIARTFLDWDGELDVEEIRRALTGEPPPTPPAPPPLPRRRLRDKLSGPWTVARVLALLWMLIRVVALIAFMILGLLLQRLGRVASLGA